VFKHFPEQIWTSTYQQMKNEAGTGRSPNIHWKQIFHRVSREALTQGPESREWKTLLKLLEIVRNPEAILSFQGRQIIRWKNEERGRIAFVKKCQDHISPNIFSLMKSTIDSSAIPKERKDLFYHNLEKENHDNNYFSRGEEDLNNIYYLNHNEDYINPYLKYQNEEYLEGQCDMIYMELDDEAFILSTEKSINQRIKNVAMFEEKLSNTGVNNNNEAFFFYSNNQNHDDVVFRNLKEGYKLIEEKDKMISLNINGNESIIEELKRQLLEKDQLIEEKDKKILNLERKVKNYKNSKRNLFKKKTNKNLSKKKTMKEQKIIE